MSSQNNETNIELDNEMHNEENVHIMLYELFTRYLENNRNNMILNIINDIDNIIFEDDLNRVMRESLETDKQLVRSDDFVDFKKIKYCNVDDNNKTSDNIMCSICLTVFENECDVSLTKCKHVFHTDCIKEWSRYKKDCPICRKDLKK
jgi:hypothetical protein